MTEVMASLMAAPLEICPDEKLKNSTPEIPTDELR